MRSQEGSYYIGIDVITKSLDLSAEDWSDELSAENSSQEVEEDFSVVMVLNMQQKWLECFPLVPASHHIWSSQSYRGKVVDLALSSQSLKQPQQWLKRDLW
jgi:hypothetical protein